MLYCNLTFRSGYFFPPQKSTWSEQVLSIVGETSSALKSFPAPKCPPLHLSTAGLWSNVHSPKAILLINSYLFVNIVVILSTFNWFYLPINCRTVIKHSSDHVSQVLRKYNIMTTLVFFFFEIIIKYKQVVGVFTISIRFSVFSW